MGLYDFFGSLFHKKSHVGAGAPGKPVTPARFPSGKKTQGIAVHGKVLKAAHATLGKAQGQLTKAAQALAKKPLHPAPKAHVGVAAVSPAAKAAQAKHAVAVLRANAQSKQLAQKLLAGKQALTNLSRAMVAQKKLAVSMRRPRGGGGGTVMGHAASYASALGVGAQELHPAEVAELIGTTPEEAELIGQATANPPDPNNPGFLMDGTPDPNAGGGTGGLTDNSVGTAIDNGQVSFPAPPPIDVAYPDMTAVGGIAYDGSKGSPDGFAGSMSLFNRATDRSITNNTAEIDGSEHHGFVFGQFDWKDPRLSGNGKDSGGSNKQPGGGIPWGSSLRSGMWNWVHGRHQLGSEDWHTDVPDPGYIFSSVFDPNAPAQYKNAYGQPFGPIVGNPAMPDFRGMRCDAQGNFFWLPQEAPDWLTFPLKQAAALTAKAAQDAANAAAQANAAAIAKINADAAVAQAQAAADVAAATAAANVQTAQAQGQLSQATAQQAQTQADQEQQAGALLLAQAQQAMAQQAQPAPSSPDGGDYVAPDDQVMVDQAQDSGVDEGPVDDGSPQSIDDMTPAELEEAGLDTNQGI
jgi:hypothetical protein